VSTTDEPHTINLVLTFAGHDAQDLRAFFEEARERYHNWTGAYVDRLKEYGTTKTEIEEGQRRLDRIESEWIATGILTGCKNDQERRAALVMQREEDPAYRMVEDAQARRRRHLAVDCEPSLEEAKYLRRLAEEDLRWSTASLLAVGGIVEAARHEH
jgi:hypothetical protein